MSARFKSPETGFEHGMGWRPQKADHRDFRYEDALLKAVVPEAIPATSDVTRLITRVKNQGNIGSCVAHGTTSAFEACQIKLQGADEAGCRLQVYEDARIIGGYYPGDNGCEIRDGIKATVKYGVAPESMYPYVTSKFDDPIPATVATAALKKITTNYYLLDSTSGVAATMANIKDCLANKGLPVVFGTPVYSGIMYVGQNGIIPDPSGGSIGGHCMLFVGHNDNTGYFKILNSWGEGWGQAFTGYGGKQFAGGIGYLSYKGYQNLISDNEVVAMESQITPTPTPTPTPTVDPFVYGFGAVSLDGVTDECFGIRAKDKVLMYRHGVTGTWRSLEGICTSEPEIIKYSTTKMGVILKGSDNQPYKKVTTDGGKTWSTWKLWK